MIPQVDIAWIGGSGSWGIKTHSFPDYSSAITSVEDIPPTETAFGLSAPFHLMKINNQPVIHFTMHGWHPEATPDGGRLSTFECSKQVAEICRMAGVKYALTDASVGGVAHPVSGMLLPPNSAVITHDYIRYCQPENFPPPVPGIKGRTYRMGEPLCAGIRKHLYDSVLLDPWFTVVAPFGVYGFTIGPFETGAEIQKVKRDGCHIVGQTLYPEAALLRQREIHFATLNIVSNWAEGVLNAWVGNNMPNAMEKFYKEACGPHSIMAMVRAIVAMMDEGVHDCHCESYVLTGMSDLPADYN